jgi:tRNA pseudouridine38-40 synthase
MQRIALGIEYDGRAFAGWQTQPAGNAVQDAVERALLSFATVPLSTICAGRTDAGVHASYQVVHIDSPVQRSLQSWVRGVNSHLPASVAVRWARAVDADFHARFGARGRSYDYWLLNDPVRSPLLDGRAGWVFRPLDLAFMQQEVQCLLGTHDFSSFRSAECQAATAVRDLRQADISRVGRLVRLRFTADAFLHHMVRNLVGALVEVGLHRRPTGWLADALRARDRSAAAATFSPAGLYLRHVQYDDRFGLPGPDDHGPFLAMDVSS